MLDELITKCVILIEDREEIEKKPTTQVQRNNVLLHILINWPFLTFYELVDALDKDEKHNEDVQCLLRKMGESIKQPTACHNQSQFQVMTGTFKI